MQSDFKLPPTRPPERPTSPTEQPPLQPTTAQAAAPDQPHLDTPPPKRLFPKWLIIITSVSLLLVFIILGTLSWYNYAVMPRDAADTSSERLTIASGESLGDIAADLENKQIIRSSLAFQAYVRLNNSAGNLQAGTYALSSSMSVSDIVDHFVSGKFDSLNVTIKSGQTIKQIKNSLVEDYGFTRDEVEQAFAMPPDHPVLANRPAGASLEGYVYPETYRVAGDGSVSEILTLSFNELSKQLSTNDLQKRLSDKGFNVHQALTLASIIQKEVYIEADQRQVSQVFQRRLSVDMELGSDVTFIYAADLLGVEPSINLDSPYNTRRYKGLPPGPIANFNPSALNAVADPSPGDFMYFVADPDGKTYYARTFDEHQSNVNRYCGAACR